MAWQIPYSLILIFFFLLQGFYFLQYFNWNKKFYILHYSLFILFISAYILIANAVFYNVFNAQTLAFLQFMSMPIGTIGFVFYYYFLQQFFSTKVTSPVFHRLLNYLIISTVVLLALKYSFPNWYYLQNAVYFKSSAIFALPIYILIFYFIVISKQSYTYLIKIGVGILLIGILISIVVSYAIKNINMEHQSIAHIPAQIGMLLELVLTSVAIAKRERIGY